MSCEKYQEMISAKLDSELFGEEQKVLSSHLESCPECRRFADELESFMQLSSSSQTEQMPPALETRILDRTVRSAGERKSLWRFFHGYYRVPRGVAWAAMLAALLLITDAIVKTDLQPVTTNETAVESETTDSGIRRIVLTEDDIVSTSILLKSADES